MSSFGRSGCRGLCCDDEGVHCGLCELVNAISSPHHSTSPINTIGGRSQHFDMPSLFNPSPIGGKMGIAGFRGMDSEGKERRNGIWGESLYCRNLGDD